MNNIRNNIKRDFTTIPNALINDNELTDRARFLFCYMASKPKPPFKAAQPTKVHVEQPVLTQQDIEASEQHFAGVRAMFKQMGV